MTTPSEARKLWVEALRSGKYTQTTGALHNAEGYCCLGVACEVYIEQGGELKLDTKETIISYDGYTRSLPESVRAWLGLWDEMGPYSDSSLAEENDNGATFSEIANIIEDPKSDGLFVEEDYDSE